MEEKLRKKTKKGVFLKIIALVCMIAMFFSGVKIAIWWKENTKTQNLIHEISKKTTIDENNKYKIDIQELKKENPDTVGWIKIENTNIEYPIVQTSNNDYYLKHTFDKSKNSAGWIFADYRNKLDGTDKNIVIYGHNRRDTSMFGTLKNTLNEEWYNNEENGKIHLIIGEESYEYQIFSIYKIQKEDFYLTTNFKAENEFKKYIDRAKSKSVKSFNVEVNVEDSLLTLSTCADNTNYRIVVHAKKI